MSNLDELCPCGHGIPRYAHDGGWGVPVGARPVEQEWVPGPYGPETKYPMIHGRAFTYAPCAHVDTGPVVRVGPGEVVVLPGRRCRGCGEVLPDAGRTQVAHEALEDGATDAP